MSNCTQSSAMRHRSGQGARHARAVITHPITNPSVSSVLFPVRLVLAIKVISDPTRNFGKSFPRKPSVNLIIFACSI